MLMYICRFTYSCNLFSDCASTTFPPLRSPSESYLLEWKLLGIAPSRDPDSKSCPMFVSWRRWIGTCPIIRSTYRELTRNRRVGQRERGLDESFSLVSPYSSVSKPRGGFPLINGKGIPYMGGSATQNLFASP